MNKLLLFNGSISDLMDAHARPLRPQKASFIGWYLGRRAHAADLQAGVSHRWITPEKLCTVDTLSLYSPIMHMSKQDSMATFADAVLQLP